MDESDTHDSNDDLSLEARQNKEWMKSHNLTTLDFQTLLLSNENTRQDFIQHWFASNDEMIRFLNSFQNITTYHCEVFRTCLLSTALGACEYTYLPHVDNGTLKIKVYYIPSTLGTSFPCLRYANDSLFMLVLFLGVRLDETFTQDVKDKLLKQLAKTTSSKDPCLYWRKLENEIQRAKTLQSFKTISYSRRKILNYYLKGKDTCWNRLLYRFFGPPLSILDKPAFKASFV